MQHENEVYDGNAWITNSPPRHVEGRLTLESGMAVSTSDQSDKSTLYFTPHLGERISLYYGGKWITATFTEKNVSLSGLEGNAVYDIFGYHTGSDLALEVGTEWDTANTRSVELTTQDGVLVESGDPTRLYLGTIYVDSTPYCHDADLKRYVWNYYNQERRKLYDSYGASHTYSGGWRAWNNSTTIGSGRAQFVMGLRRYTLMYMHGYAYCASDGIKAAAMGLGLNSTSSPSIDIFDMTLAFAWHSSRAGTTGALLPLLGLNYIQALEDESGGASSATFATVSIGADLYG